ncbi:HIT family protein [Undibacterium sp. LX40W]|uniref:HIT family protein n=2 Tax=Oxalobacteraceae TaxID=75682 RepID=A0A923KT71_9BURK|nr:MULTISPECIES: HIT family protein [Undibacterium]MBC3880997.1 HIT family protein [Undibacterium nitidum]MBC3890270.1 HIT family protein [Undibacterium sp. LX40W]
MTQVCELCTVDGGEVIVNTTQLRVVLIDDANYPGFCRVIWNAHAKEMTDLPISDRSSLMQAVCKVEQAVRDVMQPHKINLASLGNMVPHLHWHVIPRYLDDAHFPNPIWANADRSSLDIDAKRALLPTLRAQIQSMFAI